ncbi:porin [Flavobacterium sp. I3-2]|uniref:porin n=1 Tax=Flavobacterium sp. I3-2 TaxID=2748319 RepID=UPI0015AE4905|nr:porin [Flavobacterium sp. I3-2]
MKQQLIISIFSLFVVQNIQAQEPVYEKIEVHVVETKKEEVKYPKLKLGGVFQARYLANFKKDVDINGLQHSDGKSVDNSFEIKRMRISLAAQISENLELNTLINLADFKNDPKTRVLENAFAKYTVNKHLQIQAGQFRPQFGIEDSHAVDIIKSIDWSNAYYLMGSNGWQSFQIGVSAGGQVDLGKIPMNYSVAITNGNGKNTTDNNNGKHYTSRVWLNLDKKKDFAVGISGGIGEENAHKVYAYGFDFTYKVSLAKNWSVDFRIEGYQATNHVLYASVLATLDEVEAAKLNIDDYMLQGFYILPNLRYEIGNPRFKAIELSLRYEYLDASSKIDSNPRQTWTPMLSLEFLKNYGARLQIGMQFDNYKTNIANTKNYNSSLAFVQFQCRL